MQNRPKVVAVVGPTCTGKTAAALAVAGALSGEIVSLDSMQLYRGLDIGTAKATAAELAAIPHHLIDILTIDQSFTVNDYRQAAGEAIEGILSRGHLPILAGGTGLYLDALRYDMRFGEADADPAYRQQLHAIADGKEGAARLHAMLEEADPEAAQRLHVNDVRRVIRALEVARAGCAAQAERRPGPYDIRVYGLTLPREMLYARIDKRVDEMIKCGLTDEVARMLAQCPAERWGTAAQAIGYKELIAALAGAYDMDEAVRLIKRNTRRYAKRQLTWFRRDDSINWFDVSAYDSPAALHAAMIGQIQTNLWEGAIE